MKIDIVSIVKKCDSIHDVDFEVGALAKEMSVAERKECISACNKSIEENKKASQRLIEKVENKIFLLSEAESKNLDTACEMVLKMDAAMKILLFKKFLRM